MAAQMAGSIQINDDSKAARERRRRHKLTHVEEPIRSATRRVRFVMELE